MLCFYPSPLSTPQIIPTLYSPNQYENIRRSSVLQLALVAQLTGYSVELLPCDTGFRHGLQTLQTRVTGRDPNSQS